MNSWTVTVVAWLLDFGLLASVVLAASSTLRWCFREPVQRVALAWGTWLGLLALAVAVALPQWPRISLLAQSTKPPAATVFVEQAWEAPPAVPALPLELLALASEFPSPPEAATAVSDWRELLALGWLATVGLALAWIAIAMLQTWRLVRRSVAAPQWITRKHIRSGVCKRRPPQVRTSQRLTSAAAVGAIAPRILLPESAADESRRSHVRAALAHEWAHISRGDLWLLALERLLLPLLAWQPLFWWLRRSVRLDLELLADTAAAGDEPVEYAEALVAWAKTADRAPAGLAALSLWESPHTLSRRVTMLLDPKRTTPPAAHRGWHFLLAATVLILVGGLSLLTVRAQSAGGQEAQPAADEPASTVAGTADKTPVSIVLQCLVLEANRAEFSAVLPIEDAPRFSPDAEVVLQAPDDWKSRLTRLTARPGTRILSRPQVIALDGQSAAIYIGDPEGAVDPHAPTATLRLRLTPRLKTHENEQRVALDVNAVQVIGEKKPDGTFAERKVIAEADVELGKTVIITSRPEQAEQRLLVMAVEVQLAQRGEGETAQDPPPAPPSPARADDLQKIVRQLERQLAERTAEAERQRDQSEALRKQLQDVKAELEKLTNPRPTPQMIVFHLKFTQANDVATAVNTWIEEATLLSGDSQVASIRVRPDPRLNTVIVTALSRHMDAIKTVISRLDQQPAQQSNTPPSQAANMGQALQNLVAKGLITRAQALERLQAEEVARAERETQVQLLKLDMQEAEIGLNAAQKDLQRGQELQKHNSISQSEVAKFELQARGAEIKVMRAKIMLEGAMKQLQQSQPPKETNDPNAPPPPPKPPQR